MHNDVRNNAIDMDRPPAPAAAKQPGPAVAGPTRLRLLASRLPVDFGITVIINFACALMITYLLRNGQPLYVNMVFSMCIGTLALLFIDGTRLLVWKEERPSRLPFFALVLIAIVLAQQLGNRLAALLLGLPDDHAKAFAHNAVEYFTITILACLAVTWFFWNRGRLAYLQAQAEAGKARAAAIERQAAQAQLQLLQAQIEPHMLFNTLANLQGLIALDPPRAQQLLDQLIQYLRASLTSSRAATTTLAHEFTLMQAYLGLMSVRMGARLTFALDLPVELRDLRIAPMLLQPVVENAIKHGLEPKIDGGRVEVRAERKDGMLALCVADTGLGLDAAPEATQGTRVGLENVRERLRALYGAGAAFSLEANHPCGAVARIAIPFSVLQAQP